MFVVVDEADGTYWIGGGNFDADASKAVKFPTESQARDTAQMLQDEVFEEMKLTTRQA
jgi:hypothetical protein